MKIPLIISTDEFSDLISIEFATHIPKQPVGSNRDAAARAPVSVSLAAGRPRRRAGPARDGPGNLGTRLVVPGDPIG